MTHSADYVVSVQGEYIHVTMIQGPITVHRKHKNTWGDTVEVEHVIRWAQKDMESAQAARTDGSIASEES